MRHGYNVTVMVWLSGTACYFPQFLVVVSPEELPTFLFDFSWCLLLFVVHFFGLKFIACLL